MWIATKETIENGILCSIESQSNPISFAEILTLWQTNKNFRDFFIGFLVDSPFKAFKWETPPISISSVKAPFECVLLNSPNLVRAADERSFSEYLHDCDSSVVEFQNLGNDATLVVPCPIGPSADYCHLGSFSMSAPQAQQHALWKLVGEVAQKNLSCTAKWLSTAGEGVPWLHIRLDNRPKYYGYKKYCSEKC